MRPQHPSHVLSSLPCACASSSYAHTAASKLGFLGPTGDMAVTLGDLCGDLTLKAAWGDFFGDLAAKAGGGAVPIGRPCSVLPGTGGPGLSPKSPSGTKGCHTLPSASGSAADAKGTQCTPPALACIIAKAMHAGGSRIGCLLARKDWATF